MSADDLYNVSAARLWRRVECEICDKPREEWAKIAIPLVKSYGDWRAFQVERDRLAARRAADPIKHKPVQCDLC